MEQKVFSITQNKDEIIFLSDLRLNSQNQSVGLKDLLNKITSYGYTLYHNSTRSSRGVGILISKKIKHVIRRRIDDPGKTFYYWTLSSMSRRLPWERYTDQMMILIWPFLITLNKA